MDLPSRRPWGPITKGRGRSPAGATGVSSRRQSLGPEITAKEARHTAWEPGRRERDEGGGRQGAEQDTEAAPHRSPRAGGGADPAGRGAGVHVPARRTLLCGAAAWLAEAWAAGGCQAIT